MPNGTTPEEELVERTDEAEHLPKRAEMAVAITFEDRLTVEEKERVRQRLQEMLQAALNDGQLITPYSRLPRPKLVSVQQLRYRCEQCQSKVSPFTLI